ncbi:PREDICTED: 28S ribosomal protein S18c, mitochondrial [Wasmannia auropunctata]|uniref:28S ribosomal protein S18c, mitochondrial n=1 Tax=Wasmannia auropunctata TaxID=64793 RepID=UPI0005EF3A1B|nr:PREDICTED: 28S ribosomal protein S18c, mitochondrial [Wasmannia auropunctata]
MISVFASQRIAMTLVSGKFYKSCFRTIYKSSSDKSVKIEAVMENDMPIQIENPYVKEKQQCVLCKLKIEPDYKNVRLLSQFQSRYTGRIYGRHITGLCKHKQMRLEQEIAKAQSAGLMGLWTKEPEYVKDPKLFDPNHPFRPHKY